ncbi:hypothetical protein F5877DRAFT_83018 [Lentinula edodes]|nr:hypothetical protein F5877DRAFT_83018 [Lentinula edodes]
MSHLSFKAASNSSSSAQASSLRGSHSLPLLRPALTLLFGLRPLQQYLLCNAVRAIQKQHPRLTLQLPRDSQLSNRDELGSGVGGKPLVILSAFRAVVPATGSPINQHSYAILLFYGTSNAIPMKGVVHKVLRRIRTSGGVLQTALIRFVQLAPVFLSAFHAAVSAATLLTTQPTMNTGCQPPSSPAAPAYSAVRDLYVNAQRMFKQITHPLNADMRADRTSSVG